MSDRGQKFDSGKQPWFAMPLELLEPLADVFAAGERKYSTFNCLQPFDEPDRRFWDATMRHLTACQIDPLAIDEETGCYHAAQAVFNLLLRIHNAKRGTTNVSNGIRPVFDGNWSGHTVGRCKHDLCSNTEAEGCGHGASEAYQD